MATKADICNMAIGHNGTGKTIANVDTDETAEAQACRTFYATALESTLRDFRWPFAKRYLSLALIEEDPNDFWSYSYRYPTDCLIIRKIFSGNRTDSRSTRVEYEIAGDDTARLIYTDEEDAQVEYTKNLTDPAFYPPDFILAFSLKLGALITPRVTKGDPFKIQRDLEQKYLQELSRAQANALNEEQVPQDPDSEFISVRG